ncbi:hypothetical protein PIROE2DRAFT_12675 [Piromyces sp. E2]|nr:hypothetical protein PIROE2DRAFT_12675 [Piromyces sp. E2]|eukprot:OUM61337.1 hypothetical protein PIROE2DRAFT_12675 [Piromyces sp. E2]
MSSINFKDLKKELKDIEKLSKEHLDIKSWASEIQLWINLENVTDTKKIYIACVLTSIGEVREVIQELHTENEDSEEDTDNEEENDSSEEETDDTYPSFRKIVDALETFYGTKEDQNILLRELRALCIKKYEKRKKQVSVLDYAESLQYNVDAWKRVSLKDDISLTKAFKVAKKVDRLSVKTSHNSYTGTPNLYGSSRDRHFNKQFVPSTSNSSSVNSSVKTSKINSEIDDITQKMKNLSIKTYYFCRETGHFQRSCPKLRSIIEENRRSFYDYIVSATNRKRNNEENETVSENIKAPVYKNQISPAIANQPDISKEKKVEKEIKDKEWAQASTCKSIWKSL